MARFASANACVCSATQKLPPDQQRRYLFNGFLRFFERGARITPHAMLLDDLQWADESTLLLLQFFAQQLERIPLLIIGTYRDVDLDVERPFAEMLETLAHLSTGGRAGWTCKPHSSS